MVSKEELRSLLEKAQAANITLRAKNRDATRAAKTTAAEIMELTAQIVKLEKKLSTQTKKLEKPEAAPVKRGRKAAPKAAEPEVAPETTEI
jgi:dsDNA-specific endonuclease/ATPase MutS2